MPVEQRPLQLRLWDETAEDPSAHKAPRADAGADRSPRRSATRAAPKSFHTEERAAAATMAAVITRLDEAFQNVATNKGAAGPDRMDIETVRAHWPELRAERSRQLGGGSYEPGMIRSLALRSGSGALRRQGFARVARAFPGAGRVKALKSREKNEGMLQGGPLSPLLSNIVLDELDRELERRGLRFVRYADDCNIFVRSERAGHRVMASAVRFIEGRLRLKVNLAKSAVARPEERHFLGFSLRPAPLAERVEVLPSTRTRERLREALAGLAPRTPTLHFPCDGVLDSPPRPLRLCGSPRHAHSTARRSTQAQPRPCVFIVCAG